MLEAIGIIIACCLGIMQIYEKFWEAPRREKLRIWETRPELEIVDVRPQTAEEIAAPTRYDAEGFFASVEASEWRRDVLYATYRQDDFDAKNWRGVVFTLRNNGKTNIDELCVASLEKRAYSLFPCDWNYPAAETPNLHYCLYVDKPIRVGETLTLALRYNAAWRRVPGVYLFSLVSVAPNRDRYWKQTLTSSNEPLDLSEEISRDEYLDETNVARAEKINFGPNL